MVAKNSLYQSPPFPVEKVIKLLGTHLRKARHRRQLSIKQVAEKIGTGTRAVRDAENGKHSTSIVVYAALLWLYNREFKIGELLNPADDQEGIALESLRSSKRVRASKGLDDDF